MFCFRDVHNINIPCNLVGKNIVLIPQRIYVKVRQDNSVKTFVRISPRLFSQTTSRDKRSGCSSLDSHSPTFISKQFESISLQKVDLKYMRKLLTNKELPFLFNCNFFIPKRSSMNSPPRIKSIFLWLQQFLTQRISVLNSFTYIFFLSFLVAILEKATLVIGESFFTCFKIFLTLFSRFFPLVISFIPA